MKISIITTGNLQNMKGVMNYVNEKNHQFNIQNDGSYTVTCYILHFYYSKWLSRLYKAIGRRADNKQIRETTIVKNDVVYNVVNIKLNVISILKSAIFCQLYPNNIVKQLISKNPEVRKCDVISSHQLPAHYFAMLLKDKYGIPYITTWHGSDINVSPFESKRIFIATKSVLEAADMNYFVSKKLVEASDKITTKAKKDYIYTGPSHLFSKPSIADRQIAKNKFDVNDSIVITFLGNLIPIKNVMSLPSIFKKVSEQTSEKSVKYWIIGDGHQEGELRESFLRKGLNVTMYGKVSPELIPEYLKATDILVLPSINEGLPLSILEAIVSGCHVVASKVGGIPECVIPQNCISHGENFVEDFSHRISDIINQNECPASLSDEFSWKSAVQKEITQSRIILQK